MAAGRFYNSARWRRVRALQLSLNPLCHDCHAIGRMVMASCVDHIVPLAAGGPALDLANLRSLCQRCHSRKTARGTEAGAVRTAKPIKGCDIHGNPLDPTHHWNTKP